MAVAVGLAAVLAGCGGDNSSKAPAPASTAPSQAQEDQRDTRVLARQVNREISDRSQNAAGARGTFVEAETSCTKQSDTAYKCLTTFTSPPGFPSVVTNVTCDRNGGSCITEMK